MGTEIFFSSLHPLFPFLLLLFTLLISLERTNFWDSSLYSLCFKFKRAHLWISFSHTFFFFFILLFLVKVIKIKSFYLFLVSASTFFSFSCHLVSLFFRRFPRKLILKRLLLTTSLYEFKVEKNFASDCLLIKDFFFFFFPSFEDVKWLVLGSFLIFLLPD